MHPKLQRLVYHGLRLRTQFFAGIGGAVVLTVTASVIGWLSIERIGNVQRRVNEGSVPEMVAALAVAREATNLVAAAPGLTTAANPQELAAADTLDATRRAFAEGLEALEATGARAAETDRLRGSVVELTTNIDAISEETARRFPLRAQGAALQAELGELQDAVDATIGPAMDDQLFYIVTGYRELGCYGMTLCQPLIRSSTPVASELRDPSAISPGVGRRDDERSEVASTTSHAAIR